MLTADLPTKEHRNTQFRSRPRTFSQLKQHCKDSSDLSSVVKFEDQRESPQNTKQSGSSDSCPTAVSSFPVPELFKSASQKARYSVATELEDKSSEKGLSARAGGPKLSTTPARTEKPARAVQSARAKSPARVKSPARAKSPARVGLPVRTVTPARGVITTRGTNDSKRVWERQILGSLALLYNNENTSDTVVLLGDENVFCHRLVLDVNSKLTMSQSEENHDIQGKFTVDLLDYSEQKDTVKGIIQSFYSGKINVTSDNIKFVYKFAKMHCVWWLVSYTLKLFQDMIPDSFVEILEFGTKLSCEKVKNLCISRFDHALMTSLMDGNHGKSILNLSVSSLRVLVSTDSLNLQESDVFNFVRRWFEFDKENRAQYIEELLFNIRFHLISKENLVGVVHDWITLTDELSDSTKLKLFIKINKFIKIPGLVSVASTSSDKNSQDAAKRKLGAGDESLLQLIVHSVQNNNSARCSDTNQLMRVLRESFPRACPTTKQCVVEYISDNQLVDKTNVTSFLQTYSVTLHQSVLLLCIQYLTSNLTSNIHHVHWDRLPGNVVRDVLLQTKAGKYEFLLAEVAMRWSETHTTELQTIKSLLDTICYHNIPETYLTKVFLPHVQTLLPDARAPTCARHKTHPVTTRPMITHHKAPAELYLLKPFEISSKHHAISLDKKYSEKPLTIVNKNQNKRKGRNSPGYFVLYDTEKTLDRYPVSAQLSLKNLRQTVEKADNLQFMFLY